MRFMRKTLSLVMTIILLYSIVGSSFYGVYAAGIDVDIIVEKFEDGVLDIRWSHQMMGIKAAVVAFHKPNSDNSAVLIVSEPVLEGNQASISGLQPDYIYDITVALYDTIDGDNNPVGNPVGRGMLFFLPSITFISEVLDQEYEEIAGGGREIGSKPRLKLSWKVPRAFCDPGGAIYPGSFDPDASFIPANTNEAMEYMKESLNSLYSQSRDIAKLDYRINISTELNLLGSTSAQASLLIEQQVGDDYTAKVYGGSDTATVIPPNTAGYMSFELWGRVDANAQVPAHTEDYVLPDNDIYPGTVYYMNIKPTYKNTGGVNVPVITVGDPSDQNGSMLSGERSYTSTPIRFQITKDSANNIYLKIYKINQGSLDLPRLFYEVQVTDDPSIQGDWTIKKTLDDSYFSGPFAVTVISGVNPNNEVYYRIVVKSDSPGDRLMSLPLLYVLTVDTSRPPLPMGVAVTNRTLDTGQAVTPGGTQITVRSTDVTISWDKPLNWDDIKNDLYYHFLLNTNQSETVSPVPLYVNGVYWGSYPAKYRLVNYISAASDKVKEEGNRLSYTMKAFDLFSWEGDTAADAGAITGNGDYPDFLLPNTAYYLQLYTTKAANRGSTDGDEMSDRSVTISFTTLNGMELDVPLPGRFYLEANDKDETVEPPVNYFEVRLDKVSNIDWKSYAAEYDESKYTYETYYDYYMNLRTDTPFTLIGTTEDPGGDLIFTGADDPQSSSVKARVSEFAAMQAVNLFGSRLLPNTTYYLMVKTRLVVRKISDSSVELSRESTFSSVLPVTTVMLTVEEPDDSLRKPLAPVDFDIALDSSNIQMLSGGSVTFSWKRQEDDVIYELIRTRSKVGATDLIDSYSGDPEYISFLREYANYGSEDESRFLIDPAMGTGAYSGKFTYDSKTKMCSFTVDKGIFPNRLYYFSLKAVRADAASPRAPLVPAAESVWVSIPVTTSLIDPPLSIEAIPGAELAFWWKDSTPGLGAGDYRIYVKKSSEAQYTLMSRAQSTIIKDMDGETYYGRVTGLKTNSFYDVRVVKGVSTPVLERIGEETRDSYHELEIKWTGLPLDSYSRYEIALMAEGESDYTILSVSDLEHYVSKDGALLPYYPEETAMTVNTEIMSYHARIKSADVTLAGGIKTNQPLRSNTKYYIKVRAVKIDPMDPGLVAYSKYTGPVDIRTEFSQEEYDNTDREVQQKAVFLDKMKEFERGYYWRVSIGSAVNTILLKGDRVADAIRNTPGDSFVVDMGAITANLKSDEMYIPFAVIKAMDSYNKNLVIRTKGAEYVLRPAVLDVYGNEQIKEISARQEVRDLYVRVLISRTDSPPVALPANSTGASEINELNMQAFGLSVTDDSLREMFHDRIYDEGSGLVSEKLSLLLNTYVGTGTGSAALINQYTDSLINVIEKELSYYIDNSIKLVKLNNTVKEIIEFDTPVLVSLSVAGGSQGVKLPYVLYYGASAWQKLTAGITESKAGVRFNLMKAGRFLIMTAQGNIRDIPAGHWAEEYIRSLVSKYDLSDVFTGINSSFMPENHVTCREIVLLYEKVTGRTAENAGLDIRQKNVKLGLDSIIGTNDLMKNIKRQETAAVLVKLFSVKQGVSVESLRAGGRIDFTDEGSIGDRFYNSVLIIVDMDVMSVDSSGRFRPADTMTRAEAAAAFVRMLRITGEM